MAIQRIDSRKHHGWQARAHTTQGEPRLTKFVSDSVAGGKRAARRVAAWHECRLKAQARRMRGGR